MRENSNFIFGLSYWMRKVSFENIFFFIFMTNKIVNVSILLVII